MTDTNFYIARNSSMLHPQKDGTIPTEVQLIPIGKIQGRDSRSFCLNNIDEVIKNSIARFNPSKDSNSLDLVIDYEHQTFNSEKNGEPAPAAGWIKQLLNKGSQGLWGVVDWTSVLTWFKNQDGTDIFWAAEENPDIAEAKLYLFTFRSFDFGATWHGSLDTFFSLDAANSIQSVLANMSEEV